MVDTGQTGRRQHQLVNLAARRGHYHDDFRHTGNLGRNGIHQDRGRIGRLATGDVKPYPIQRSDLLAKHGAISFGVAPGVLALVLVVTAHTLGGHFQRAALRRSNAFKRQLQAGAIKGQIGHIAGREAVKAFGVLDQRRITAGAHRCDNFLNPVINRLVGDAFPGQQGIQMLGKIALVGVQTGDFQRRTHSDTFGDSGNGYSKTDQALRRSTASAS